MLTMMPGTGVFPSVGRVIEHAGDFLPVLTRFRFPGQGE